MNNLVAQYAEAECAISNAEQNRGPLNATQIYELLKNRYSRNEIRLMVNALRPHAAGRNTL